MANLKSQLLELFEKNPNEAYGVSDLKDILKTDTKNFYSDLQYLVNSKIVVKIFPGLNGGRKCLYTKRNKIL